MTTTARLWAASALVLFSLIVALPAAAKTGASTKTPAAATSTSLAARLGGTKSSFEKKLGTAQKGKGGPDVAVFTVKGYGLFAVAFTNSHASEITIAADRLNHKPLTESDKADWSVAAASTNAEGFLPADATFGKPAKSKERITIVGQSKTLTPVFSSKELRTLGVGGTSGDITVDYSLDTKGDVYSVDMNLGNGTAVASSAQPTTAASAGKSGATSKQTANGPVKHCRDFQTRAEAQAYFDAHGGDSNPAVSGMDGDKDGKVCEMKP